MKGRKRFEMQIGGLITKAGSSKEVKTGKWRVTKPIWDRKKCVQCLMCAIYCPENTIPAKEGKRKETNLTYCKGCGICAQVCPVKAIKMKEEATTL